MSRGQLFTSKHSECRVAWCCRKGFPRQGPSGWLKIAVIQWYIESDAAMCRLRLQRMQIKSQKLWGSAQMILSWNTRLVSCIALWLCCEMIMIEIYRNDRITLPLFCQLRFKFLKKSLSKKIPPFMKASAAWPIIQQILVVQGIPMCCNPSPPWRPKAKPNSKYSCRWKYDIKSYQIISNHTRNNITIISFLQFRSFRSFSFWEPWNKERFDSIGTRTLW